MPLVLEVYCLCRIDTVLWYVNGSGFDVDKGILDLDFE